MVQNSNFIDNTNNGVLAMGSAFPASVQMTDSLVANNGINGIATSSGLAAVVGIL